MSTSLATVAHTRLSKPTSFAWYADERFWRVVEPWLFPEAFWVAAPYEVESILELTAVPAAPRVLDLACGPGRTALQFARYGARVTGVDLSQSYLDAARANAERENLKVEWVRADMRDYIESGAFDLAVCLYNSFGYLEDSEDDLRVLENVHASLSDDGRFVLDHLGQEICAHAVRSEPYRETRGGLEVEHCADLLRDGTVLRCEWRVTGEGVEDRFVTEQRVYSANALSDLMRSAGFREVEVFGDYERSDYTPESGRLLVVARA